MDTIHQVIISNTPSLSSVTAFFDVIKPKEAKQCFICVDKFNAQYLLNAGYHPTEFFEVHCDAIQNSYRYNLSSQMVLRSDILDIFATKDIVNDIACFTIINNKDNWLEIDINRLNNMKFTYVNNYNTASLFVFSYNLHLKLKFI